MSLITYSGEPKETPMNIGIALLAAFIGYLSGSISYAFLVTRLAAPGGQLSKISVTVPDIDLQI